jgi:hypothetical protein
MSSFISKFSLGSTRILGQHLIRAAFRDDSSVCPPNDGKTAVVEPAAGMNGPNGPISALRQRIRQQAILAELGVSALQVATLNKLLEDTVRLTAEGLQTDFAKFSNISPWITACW